MTTAAALTLSKISCLSITRARLPLLRRAIDSYCRQTYARRELVIVADGEAEERRQLEVHLDQLGRDDIRLHFLDGERRTLGALRNLSLDLADGELVCQWDDDDYSHPERLSTQARRLDDAGAQACFLSDHLQLFEDDRALRWIDWMSHGRRGQGALHPGTLLMRKQACFRYPETGAYANRGEDSVLLSVLHDHGKVTVLSGAGHLYLYTYHGGNTFPELHHRRISMVCLSIAALRERESILREVVRSYPLPRPITIVGAEGVAYIVEADDQEATALRRA
jgi:glycosyltransferase involved in cell wall biosynthesis